MARCPGKALADGSWSSYRVTLMKHFVTVLALLIPTAASAAEAPKEWSSALWSPTSVSACSQTQADIAEKSSGGTSVPAAKST